MQDEEPVTQLQRVGGARFLLLVRFLLLGFLCAHLLFLLLWLRSQMGAAEPPVRDWVAFRLAAERLLEGDLGSLYGTVDWGYAWRYPPYALYLVVPLAVISPKIAYVLAMGAGIVATGLALWALRGSMADRRGFGVIALCVVSSAPFASTIINGQLSAILLLSVASALWALERGRGELGWGLLGALWLKPNWIPGFLLLGAGQRRWRGLAVLMAVGAALVLSSMPLGSELWPEFLADRLGSARVGLDYPAHLQSTVLSALTVLIPGGAPLYLAWVAIGTALTAVLWLTLRNRDIPLARQVGACVLFTLSANVYVFFYDNLLLAVPAAAWWACRTSYRSRSVWIMIGACIGTVWIWDHAVFYWPMVARALGVIRDYPEPAASIVGVVVALWLALEWIDSLVRPDRAR